MTSTRMIAIAALGVLVAAIGGSLGFIMTGQKNDKYAACRATAVAGGKDMIGGPFTLVDETGKTVTDKDVITQPSLLYFGYTYCPDVCPLDNARNAEAIEILEERGAIVQPVFISVDPDRDTPEVLADFTDNLHPRMLGLTGSAEQVAAASAAYRTYYSKRPAADGDEEFYLIDHSTSSYLVFPDEGFVEFFRRDETPGEMADRLQCFIEAHG